MTTAQALDIFKILQDKYASPSLIDSEILTFLNMAQYERINRVLPDDMGGVINFEFDQNVASNIRHLIYPLTGLSATSDVLLNTTINTALAPIAGTGAELFRILNVSVAGKPAKYVNQNNLLTQAANYFKAPSANYPRYSLLATGFKFYPSPVVAGSISMVVMKKPKTITLTVNPEWDDYNMNLVVMIALQLAGVSTRDEELIGDIRNIQTTK
jgi:hypothetical protein